MTALSPQTNYETRRTPVSRGNLKLSGCRVWLTTDGKAVGVTNNYAQPNDARVIAANKVFGEGEAASVELDVAKPGPWQG